MGNDLQWAGRCVVSVFRGLFWLAATTWLGAVSICRLVSFFRRLPEIRSEVLVCPRGHESPAYGVFECTTTPPVHLHEGWAFGRCVVCGLSAGWTPCRTCGLPILNPLRQW